jgi:hypothetical protein
MKIKTITHYIIERFDEAVNKFLASLDQKGKMFEKDVWMETHICYSQDTGNKHYVAVIRWD